MPLSREAFRQALRRGQGRAALHVAGHGASGLEDLILDAATFDRTYDAQCEALRADWLIELVDAAGLEAQVVAEVIRKLDARDAADSTWDLEQRCELAAIYARRGHDGSHAALYRAFRKLDRCQDLIGGDQIVDLDGADGLIFVAQRIGDWYTTGTSDSTHEGLMKRFDAKHGEKTAERLLASVAQNDSRVAAYLEHLRVHWADETSPQTPIRALPESATDLIAEIDKGVRWATYAYGSWGLKSSDEDLRMIAKRMFREKDPDRLQRLIAVFQRRAMPEFDARLIQFADHSSEDIRSVAIQAMANNTAAEIRSLALKRISASRIADGEIDLFRKNYAEGDWKNVISCCCRLPQGDHELHRFLIQLLHVFECLQDFADALFDSHQSS